MPQSPLLGHLAAWLEPNVDPFPPRPIVGKIISVTQLDPATPTTIAVADRGEGEVHYVTLDGSIPVWIDPPNA